MALIAIDPGRQGLAFACFRDGQFDYGFVEHLPEGLGPQREQARAVSPVTSADTAVVEEMVYYPQRGSAKASSQIAALLHLQTIGALAAAPARAISWCPARRWKGSLPKGVCRVRVRAALDKVELTRLEDNARSYGARGHNLWDAVGLGLYCLGRMRP